MTLGSCTAQWKSSSNAWMTPRRRRSLQLHFHILKWVLDSLFLPLFLLCFVLLVVYGMLFLTLFVCATSLCQVWIVRLVQKTLSCKMCSQPTLLVCKGIAAGTHSWFLHLAVSLCLQAFTWPYIFVFVWFHSVLLYLHVFTGLQWTDQRFVG